jgi:hypothetical protein
VAAVPRRRHCFAVVCGEKTASRLAFATEALISLKRNCGTTARNFAVSRCKLRITAKLSYSKIALGRFIK